MLRSPACALAMVWVVTGDEQRLTISEVAADWRELMVRPSVSRSNGQLDRSAADRQNESAT